MNLRSIGLFLLLCAIPAVAQVATGIDVLEQQNFAPLKEIATRHGGHLRLAVLTNLVGIDAHERRTIDVLRKDAAAAVPGLSVKVIFAAEHGMNAAVDTAACLSWASTVPPRLKNTLLLSSLAVWMQL
jgi:uncharacterized protein YbbC (DUF1343 family)